MKRGKYILIIILILFLTIYFFSSRITPQIENIAHKEINQFMQILINHTSFTQKIETKKLYKKENNTISFQMSYINDLATNYINNLEETLLKLEDGTYKKKDTSPYNKKLLHISKQQGIIARVPLGSLTNNIFLQNVGPSLSIKYKTLSLTSSNINKKIKNYGINHLAISIDLNITITLQCTSGNARFSEKKSSLFFLSFIKLPPFAQLRILMKNVITRLLMKSANMLPTIGTRR